MKTWIVCLAIPVAVVATEVQEFARYQPILDRAPFGAVTAAGAGQEVPQPLQKFQLVGLVNSNGQEGPVQAIIFDKEGNRSYFLSEGETIAGSVRLTKLEVGPPVKATLQTGLETASLIFQQRPAGPAGPVIVQPNQPAMQPGVQPIPGQPAMIQTQKRIPFRRGN